MRGFEHRPARRATLGGAALLAGGLARWQTLHHRSPIVRSWQPGAGHRRRTGRLSVRVAGTGPGATVLLHGITASGDVFGAGYDRLARSGPMVVPDLLGFGRSMQPAGRRFGLDDHLDALDETLAALGLLPAVVLGHSLGALLALHWAARRPDIERVIAVAAPLYRSAAEADRRIGEMGLLEKLFAHGAYAQQACRVMCRHRRAAGWAVVALEPRWPVAIARAGVLHTWPSYSGAMDGVIRAANWHPALDVLAARGAPVRFLEGARDRATIRGARVRWPRTTPRLTSPSTRTPTTSSRSSLRGGCLMPRASRKHREPGTPSPGRIPLLEGSGVSGAESAGDPHCGMGTLGNRRGNDDR